MKVLAGQCSPGCGACCRVVALPFEDYERDVTHNDWYKATAIRLQRKLKGDFRKFLQLHESDTFYVTPEAVLADRDTVRRGTYSGSPVVYIQAPCQALRADGMCSLYGKPERPRMCGVWPTPEDDLWVVRDACTYRLEEAA